MKKSRFVVKAEKSPDCVGEWRNIDYPLFSFRYFDDTTIKKVKEGRFFIEFLNRLAKLSELGWSGIATSARHSYGLEQMPTATLRRTGNLPPIFSGVEKLDVFRATGDKRVFAGVRDGKVFHILMIEYAFGDVSPH